jgi:hypothetical protein
MAWGPLISLVLRALPDLLFLWRRRVERGERDGFHDGVQEFKAALVGGDLDRAAVLLDERVREARRVRQRRAEVDSVEGGRGVSAGWRAGESGVFGGDV